VVLADCAQLVKANSIEGNKKATGKVRIVYTLWSNLHKTKGMADGSVDFKENKAVRIAGGWRGTGPLRETWPHGATLAAQFAQAI
jgi:hypothetical protein